MQKRMQLGRHLLNGSGMRRWIGLAQPWAVVGNSAGESRDVWLHVGPCSQVFAQTRFKDHSGRAGTRFRDVNPVSSEIDGRVPRRLGCA